MSIDFRLSKRIRISELLDGRLDSYGVHQSMHAETSAKEKCLTDGHNFIWVFIDDEGFIDSLTRWAPNGNPQEILCAIAEVFDTPIFSEHEPQYWGFDTEAEWYELSNLHASAKLLANTSPFPTPFRRGRALLASAMRS